MDDKTAKNDELTDEEVQLSILTMLFNKRKTQPKGPEVLKEKIIEVLGIPEDRIIFNAGYLEEKKLIEFVGETMGVGMGKNHCYGNRCNRKQRREKESISFLRAKNSSSH